MTLLYGIVIGRMLYLIYILHILRATSAMLVILLLIAFLLLSLEYMCIKGSKSVSKDEGPSMDENTPFLISINRCGRNKIDQFSQI